MGRETNFVKRYYKGERGGKILEGKRGKGGKDLRGRWGGGEMGEQILGGEGGEHLRGQRWEKIREGDLRGKLPMGQLQRDAQA